MTADPSPLPLNATDCKDLRIISDVNIHGLHKSRKLPIYQIDLTGPLLARSMEIKFTYIKELSDYTVNTSHLLRPQARSDGTDGGV